MAYRNAKDYFAKKPWERPKDESSPTPSAAKVTILPPEPTADRKKDVEDKRKSFESMSKAGGRISQGSPTTSQVASEEMVEVTAENGERTYKPRTSSLRRTNSLLTTPTSNPFLEKEKERMERKRAHSKENSAELFTNSNSIHEARLRYGAIKDSTDASASAFTVHFGKDDKLSVPFAVSSARRELREILQEIAAAKKLALNDFAAFTMSGEKILDTNVMLGELGTLEIKFSLKDKPSPRDFPKAPAPLEAIKSESKPRSLSKYKDSRKDSKDKLVVATSVAPSNGSDKKEPSIPGSKESTTPRGTTDGKPPTPRGVSDSKKEDSGSKPRALPTPPSQKEGSASDAKSPRLDLSSMKTSSDPAEKKMVSPRGAVSGGSGDIVSPRRRPSGWNVPAPRAEEEKDKESSKDKKKDKDKSKEKSKDKSKDKKEDNHSNSSAGPSNPPLSPVTSPRFDENDPNLTDEQRKANDRRKRIEEYKRKKAEEAAKATNEVSALGNDESSQKQTMEKIERDAREKAAKEAQEIAERVEREAKQKAEEVLKAKLDADKKGRDKKDKEDKERKDKEKKEREEKEKKEKEERLRREKEEKDKLDKEKKEREEREKKDRLAKEKAEKERKEKEEKERRDREEKERKAQEEKARKERENAEREEKERLEKERQMLEEKKRLASLPRGQDPVFLAAQAAHQLAKTPKDDIGSESEGDLLEKANAEIDANTATVVDLKMEGLDDAAMAELFEKMENNGSVHTLALDGNEMEASSLIALKKLLLTNKHLHSLSLNFIMFGELGSRAFAPALAFNKSLTYLSVSGNDLFEKGMEALAEGLKANTSITTIILSENSISDGGCEALEGLMGVNQTITALDLSNNYINEDGGRHLGQMLKVNHSLKHLNLERNSLGDDGVIGFSEGLAVNRTLEKLSLGNNIIDVQGIVALADALKKNTSLDYVELRQNIFDTEGDVALVEALIHKRSTGTNLNIEWKRPPAKNAKPMSKTEMDVIIRHFTPLRLLEIYSLGENLLPLIEIETLLVHMTYGEAELEKLWSLAFPSSKTTSNFHAPLSLLVRILHSKIEDEKLLVETESEDGHDSSSRLQQFAISKFAASRLGNVSPKLGLRNSSNRLGFNRLQIVQFVRLLAMVNSPEVSKALRATNAIQLAAELFFQFQINSLFQHEFSTMLTHLINSATPAAHDLLRDLLLDAKFVERLMVDFDKEVASPIGKRTPHFSHLLVIANQLNSNSDKDAALSSLLSGIPKWKEFVGAGGSLAKINAQQVIPEALKPKPEDYIRKPSAFVGDLSEPVEKKKSADGEEDEDEDVEEVDDE